MWQDFTQWRPVFAELMADIFTEELLRDFRAHPPKYLVSDDMSWIESLIEKHSGKELNITTTTLERFNEKYSHIRAYHGCSPTDIHSYLDHGLRPLNIDEFNLHAKRHFCGQMFSEVTNDILQMAIVDVGAGLRENRIYFGLDDQFLINYCGHYLLYGSEYLACVAASLTRLTGRMDYQQSLKGIGKPTILACNIPTSMIENSILEELCRHMVQHFFENHLDSSHSTELDFGFEIHEPLPPEEIASYYHPEHVPDPFTY